MLKLKNAPVPSVQVQETKTLKILDVNTAEAIKRIKEKQFIIVDITDNDRNFLAHISEYYKKIVDNGNQNDVTYYISLDSEYFDMSQISLYCVEFEANTKIAKLIKNTVFENYVNKAGYTDIIIHSYDSDPEVD